VKEVTVVAGRVGLAVAWVLAASPAFAQAPKPQGESKPPLASVEGRWSDVYCDLTELSRTNPSELSVRFRYRNLRKAVFRLPHANLVPNTQAFDAAGKTLFGVLKDADQKPISSTMLDGAVSRPIAAGGTQAHWARLEAPAAGVTSITILAEGCQPFENVAIGAAPAATPVATPAPAIAGQDGEIEGLVVEVIRLARAPGGLLDVGVRYRNGGAAPLKMPQSGSAMNRRFASTYAVDSASRRKFEVAKDATGKTLNSETLGLGGSALGEVLAPGEALNVWARLAAPAETVKAVGLYVALAPPFDAVPISGTGGGAAGGGSAVAGAIVGLDAALKNLNARVSPAEIRIDLAADVLFDFDKADVKKDAEASLQNVAILLKANPGAAVAIEGHTDGKGADDYNQKLSEARAASIKGWLVANAQVNGASVTTRGWGKTKPVAHNTKPDGSDDPEGRAKNRRVEIVVRKG
jgi:outer membrane protein OmpA-like peptidoglycan-associated protein